MPKPFEFPGDDDPSEGPPVTRWQRDFGGLHSISERSNLKCRYCSVFGLDTDSIF